MDEGPIKEADGDPVVAPRMKLLIHWRSSNTGDSSGPSFDFARLDLKRRDLTYFDYVRNTVNPFKLS